MRASVCVGNYATTPYIIAGLEIPIYSMEELCYCIRENAYLLDFSLMNDSLLIWIERECGLPELARELHPLVHKQGSLSAFAAMIMEYTGLYSDQSVGEVVQVLKKGAGLSSIEKRKGQIDYFVKRKKYTAAIRGYDSLLAGWQEKPQGGTDESLPAPEVRASILYNKGVAYTGLMMYHQAAAVFWEAYLLDDKAEYFMSFLAAKRLELPEEEYISLVSEIPGKYEYSLALEGKLEELKDAWKQHVDYQRLKERETWREGKDIQKYYDENDRVTQTLKESYRRSAQE